MTKTKKYRYLIQTDASVKGTKSVHSYNIRGLKRNGSGGKVFREKGFGRLIDDPMLAEIYAITEALQYMQQKGFCESLVKTDRQDVVKIVKNRSNDYSDKHYGRDIIYLRKLLKATRSAIQYNPRKFNGADIQCHLTWEKKQFSIKGKKVRGFKNGNKIQQVKRQMANARKRNK